MSEPFAVKPAMSLRLSISKAQLRGAIWLIVLAVFVLLPKPSEAVVSPPSPVEVSGR